MKRIIYFLLLLCCSVVASSQNPDPALMKKAEAGDVEAQCRLANYYLSNTKSVSAEGMKWMTKAATNGSASAQQSLKNGYYYGWFGLDKDDEKYVYWLKKLANNIDLENYKTAISLAQDDLGGLYESGGHGIEKNLSEFIKWKKKAANNGYDPAALSLAYHYDFKGDKQEAIYWYKKKMDIKWAEYQEEDEYAYEGLRKLGVTYHPADHVGHNHSHSSTATTNEPEPYQNQGSQVREYTETVPVQVWQPCGGCNGTGQCSTCFGSGWTLNYKSEKQRCITCGGTGKCRSCAGNGGQNVVRYEQRTVYR